jgi:hypothetical protein
MALLSRSTLPKLCLVLKTFPIASTYAKRGHDKLLLLAQHRLDMLLD